MPPQQRTVRNNIEKCLSQHIRAKNIRYSGLLTPYGIGFFNCRISFIHDIKYCSQPWKQINSQMLLNLANKVCIQFAINFTNQQLVKRSIVTIKHNYYCNLFVFFFSSIFFKYKSVQIINQNYLTFNRRERKGLRFLDWALVSG